MKSQIEENYVEAVDPYARAVTLFSKRGVVVNPEKVYVDLHNDKLKPLSSITDAIIYETSIRDITSDKNTSIKEKGKYLGLTEEGVTTPKGLPVGIDYIKSLGITHVQLLPVFDFCTTNDLNPKDSYNWGYDPLNFNAPEGSYSSHPEDPYARIKELKSVIGKLHENGIRAVMDVVYNYVFNLESSNFHAICLSAQLAPVYNNFCLRQPHQHLECFVISCSAPFFTNSIIKRQKVQGKMPCTVLFQLLY